MQSQDLEPPNHTTVIPDIPTGGVRLMGFYGASWTPTRLANMCNRLKDPALCMDGVPKFVVCMIHGSPWGNPNLPTPAAYAQRCRDVALAVDADVYEIGNEPAFGTNGTAGNVNGVYFNYLIAGADAIAQVKPGVPRVMAAPYSSAGSNPFYSNANQTFTNKGLDIHDYIEGFAIHPYSVQGTPTDTINKMQSARTLVNGFGGTSGSWSDLPMYCTEAGWTPNSPNRPQDALPVGNEQGSTAGTVSNYVKQFFDLCATNRTALSLRFAGYFVWRDYSSQGSIGAAFMGIAKDTSWSASLNSPGVNVKYGSPPGGPYSNPGVQAYRPSYTVLRDQVPRGYDLGTTTPKPAVTYTTSGGLPAADGITQTSAGLHGAVNPNGNATSRYFEWGTTTAYGNQSPTFSSGSGSTPVDAHYGIPTGSLQPNTPYHFRLRANNLGGTTLGSDQTFTTLSSVSVPSVTTGPVTNPSQTGATINGVINPNSSAVSNYHFEYGATTAYGTSTTAGTLASGTVGVNVSANLIDLTAGATYHYRLVATNGQGTTNGLDATFTVTTPPTASSPDLVALTVLSIQLSVEITTADGRSFRWDADDAEAANRPQAITCASQAGDGFAEASCQLPRGVGFDWPDLHLLDRFRLIGADGSIAYEGRVAGTPRKVDSEGEAIEVQAQGLMSSSRDQMFTRIIVDRSGERWEGPSLPLRKAVMALDQPLGADYTATADSGSLMFKGTTHKSIPAGSQAILEYIAPTGEKLSAFQYTGDQRNGRAEFDQTAELHATDDDSVEMGTWDKKTLTLTGTGAIWTAALDTPRKFLGLRMRSVSTYGQATNPGATPDKPFLRRYDKIAVYGNHTIEPRANGEDPDGVYASDVITWVIDHYCPMLNADRVQQTAVPIAHLVFDTPTTPFDAFSLVNGFHLWSLGAWENGTVEYAPADLRNSDWQVRSDDPGVTLDLQGDAVDGFANGIIVSYTDIDSRQVNLFPTAYEDLRDEDPDNPANKQGIQLWTSLDISNPVDTRGALSLGRVALREFNRPKAPGVVTATLGYIEDGQGNLQPGWKVRAGHTLSIGNLPNDSPRLITATQWGEDGTLSMTLEQPPTRIDAVLARLEMGAEGRQTRRPALGRSDR